MTTPIKRPKITGTKITTDGPHALLFHIEWETEQSHELLASRLVDASTLRLLAAVLEADLLLNVPVYISTRAVRTGAPLEIEGRSSIRRRFRWTSKIRAEVDSGAARERVTAALVASAENLQ
jgi:hypothetical protein